MNYVFYDTETTGTQTAFDQILQFAAIRTDQEFNELERFNIRCRLLPHIVPAPGALRVTGVTPTMLTDPDLPSHYEAIQKIRAQLLAWSPATFVGFNSLDFDEVLLRQAFFQTLHPAYLTNTDGNRRSDAMRVAHAASIFAPQSINVPKDDRGRETFRLERLAPANGFDHEDAHEAMADVEATIHMARLIRHRDPAIWETLDSATTKNAVKDVVAEHSTFVLTERYFGRTYSWLVTPCGQNPEYDAQLAVFDLYYDPDDYRQLSTEDLVGVLSVSPKVIRSLRTNAQPIIMPADAAPQSVKALAIPPDELTRRAAIIQSDKDFRDRVGHAQALRFADETPSPYIEARIYDGFPSNADQALMAQFHMEEWPDRVALADRIEDDRVQEFARRLIYFERPDLLSAQKRAELDAWRTTRVLADDQDVPWMTVQKALQETDDLMQNAVGDDATLLSDLKDFLRTLAADAGSP